MSNEMTDRTSALEERVADLARQLMEVTLEARGAREAMRSTTEMYEQRLDQVYRRVTVSLREYLALPALDAPSEIEVDAVLSKAFGAVLKGSQGLTMDELQLALAPDLQPRPLTGPLTIHGFKLNRALARETGESILLSGAATGIALYGPYKHLASGRYELIARLGPSKTVSQASAIRRAGFLDRLRLSRAGHDTIAPGLALDVYQPEANRICSAVENAERDDESGIALRTIFEWPGGPVEFRLQNNSGKPWHLYRFELSTLKE